MTPRRGRYVRIEQDGEDLSVCVPVQGIRILVRGAPREVRERILAARTDDQVLAALPQPVFDALAEALRPAGVKS